MAGVSSPYSLAVQTLLATTGTGGYTLIAGTATVFSWTAPADGNLHRILLHGILDVSVTQVGGTIILQSTDPAGDAGNFNFYAGSQGAGVHTPAVYPFVVQAGSTVTVMQSTSLTSGAAVLFAELWGS